jgi:hypothetical protein
MEDTRPYVYDDEDEQWQIPDEERVDFASRDEDGVPFSVPRD